MKKANEYLQLLKIAYPKADAIYEDAIIEICGEEGLMTLRELRVAVLLKAASCTLSKKGK